MFDLQETSNSELKIRKHDSRIEDLRQLILDFWKGNPDSLLASHILMMLCSNWRCDN